MEATTPNFGLTGATSSGQLRTSQLDGPSGTVPRLANVEGPRILYASLGSLRVLKDLLEAIHTKDRVTVIMAPAGFKVVADHSKSAQACAYLPRALFRQYEVDPEIRSFGLSLTSLLECIQFLVQTEQSQASGTIELRIGSLEDGLQLQMQHNNVRTTCKLKTYEPEELTDFMEAFRLQPSINKIIMQAKWLKAAFEEMDASSETVHMLISPAPPYFRLSTAGASGSSEMDYPRNTAVIEQFQCDQPRLTSYRLKQLLLAMGPLKLADKVAIMTNERGLLKLQFMVDLEAGDVQWIEFYAAPMVTDEDDAEPDYVPPPSQAALAHASGTNMASGHA